MATVKLRNINPLGQVDLPLIGRQGDYYLGEHGKGNLEPGEVFDVSAEHAAILLQQASNYEPADDAAIAIDARIPANAFRHRGKPKRAPSRPRKPRPPRVPKPAAAATDAATSEKGVKS